MLVCMGGQAYWMFLLPLAAAIAYPAGSKFLRGSAVAALVLVPALFLAIPHSHDAETSMQSLPNR
jgi:hypothetical protein